MVQHIEQQWELLTSSMAMRQQRTKEADEMFFASLGKLLLSILPTSQRPGSTLEAFIQSKTDTLLERLMFPPLHRLKTNDLSVFLSVTTIDVRVWQTLAPKSLPDIHDNVFQATTHIRLMETSGSSSASSQRTL